MPLHKAILPEAVFAFRPWSIDPQKVRVLFVVSGAPYLKPEQNHGYALSVPKYGKGIVYPKGWWALMDEYSENLVFTFPSSGSLESWHKKGIMMIYHVPVHDGKDTHIYEDKGWEMLAYDTVATLSDNRERMVFVFMGKTCWYLSSRVDESKHLVLRTPYPSNMTKFRGCGIFTTILSYLGEDRYFFKLPTSKVKLR